MSTPMDDFNAKVIEEFRANEGRVGGNFEGMPMVLLHHVGARSGTERINPLAVQLDGDRYVVFASKAGAPANPGWYYNLKAHPDTTIEFGTGTIDVVAGIEARGFIFAPALAYRLGAGFVPVRKPKKLPAKTASVSYSLEYGTDTLEIHEDAVKPGQTVIICDDLLATGGTAAATTKLVEKLGGKVEGAAFAVELTFLNGRSKLNGLDIFSLIQYDK